MDDSAGFVGAFVLLALLIAAFTTGIIFLIPAAVVAVVCVLIYSHVSPNSKRNMEQAVIAETHDLYQQAKSLTPISEADFDAFALETFESLQAYNTALKLFELEGFSTPTKPPPIVTGIEGGRYRDELRRYINVAHDSQSVESFKRELVGALKPFDHPENDTGIFSARRYLTKDEIDDLARAFFGEHNHFQTLRNRLDQNFNEQKDVLPRDYRGDNCPWDYLKDTPLMELEYRNITVDWVNRDEHTLILAGSGAGKTTLYKHLIAKLLEEDCCIIVMDSQSQLIEQLAHIELGEDDVTWIAPEHKLALNPFDADPDEIKDEAVLNNAISQLEFVIDYLAEAPMTPRQKTLFYYCSQLVLSIPGANIDTFMEVLDDPFDFAGDIDGLDKTAQKFFFTELRKTDGKKHNAFDSTRTELGYRLQAVLKNPTFRRIYNTEENTFDFYSEMLERRLILLDTSHAHLAQDSPTFGRFLIAQALQACYQRVKKKTNIRRAYFFIDEAHEYFDVRLDTMFKQARKANVCMIIATQNFSKARDAGIADTLLDSTSTQIASKLTPNDARKLAPIMKSDADFLLNLPEHVFGYSSGYTGTVTILADQDPLSHLDMRDNLNQLKKDMEFHYGPEKEEELEEEVAMSQNEDHDIEPGDTL